MAPNDSQPWNPDRSWADPLIATLLLVIVLLAGGQARFRHARPRQPEVQLTLQGRFQDLLLGATSPGGLAPRLRQQLGPVADLAGGTASGWDQALLAVHAAEGGDLAAGERLLPAAPGPAGDAFRQAWRWAYRQTGAAPAPEAFRTARTALGDGFAARILEARLTARAGGDPAPAEAQAHAWVLVRLELLAAAGALALLLTVAGVAYLLLLTASPARPRPLPHFGMSGRALLLVLLGWFIMLLAAGPVATALVSLAPPLKPLYLPLVYGCHALAGLGFLCQAEGVDLRALWLRVAPGPHGRALASGLGFFALAFASVLAVSLTLGPLLHRAEPPQKDLLDLLSRIHGPLALTLLFLTVAVAAPAFEELMFRGFLLPWLGERLEARLGARRGRRIAIVFTGLCFAAMHMQPLGLPTLATLGIVLGCAFVRTGNLTTCILVHGLWNGGVFLVLRAIG